MGRILTGLLAAAFLAGAAEAATSKVCICHTPPGNPENARTICVGEPAVRAHLRHGDTMGPCAEACGGDTGNTCDVGQFCRTDAGVCDADAEGVCVAIPPSCPTTSAPVCGCDGVTYENACLADFAGVSVDHAGACSDVCGGESGATCGPGEFCKRADGTCSSDAEGVCTGLPVNCPPTFEPVCGCDGTTYSNACFADVAGVPVDHAGACAEGIACGGGTGVTCGENEFCQTAPGSCVVGGAGTCAPVPGICSGVVARVCGCDGITYDNACLAAEAGVSLNHLGACAADVQVCGGSGGLTCGDGEFCDRPVGDCAVDAEGVCETDPASCSPAIEPVCGCDGITYSNACVADALGIALANVGACVPERACGGASGGTCLDDQFCKQADGACSVTPEGVCTDQPVSCPVESVPVCGCDGLTYDNRCLADAAGVSVSHPGPC